MTNILVVDDLTIMRQAIKGYVTKLGYKVVGEASNGDEAIKLYKNLKPDIVTMDITMPAFNGILNGIDALKQIRQYDSEAKVIMLTSHGEQKLIIDAISLGAKGYILKPITSEKLDAILKKVIS